MTDRSAIETNGNEHCSASSRGNESHSSQSSHQQHPPPSSSKKLNSSSTMSSSSTTTPGSAANTTNENQPSSNVTAGPSSAGANGEELTDRSNSSNSSSSTSSKTPTSGNKDGNNFVPKKVLKGLIKKKIDPNQDFIKSHNKRIKFKEFMEVVHFDELDNYQEPQIIALKGPGPSGDASDFPPFMFEPPAEYRDFLPTFEPPPDYRDLIVNSMNVFQGDVTLDFIDDEGDDDSESMQEYHHGSHRSTTDQREEIRSHQISSFVINKDHINMPNSQSTKWKSMNLDSLEEEQIIGVLKEDEILQAIGSQISLPITNSSGEQNGNDDDSEEHLTFGVIDGHHNFIDEQLSSEDFPVHHLNTAGYMFNTSNGSDSNGPLFDEDDDEDACCIDSSPNGSLHDLASDSSITSQDTIILINNKTFHLEQPSISQANVPSNSYTENIYENVQSEHQQQMLNEVNSLSDKSKDNGDNAGAGHSNGVDCILYENTSVLLMNHANNRNSLASNSGSGSSLGGGSDDHSSVNNRTDGTMPDAKNSPTFVYNSEENNFKQSQLYFESILQQQQPPSSQQQPQQSQVGSIKMVSIRNSTANSANLFHQQQQLSSNEMKQSSPQVIISNSPIPLHLYTLVDGMQSQPQQRTSTSSSSSLSSSSTNSNPQQNSPQQQHSPQPSTAQLSLSSAFLGNQAQSHSQLSPNSSSTSSSSSSSMQQQSYILKPTSHPMISSSSCSLSSPQQQQTSSPSMSLTDSGLGSSAPSSSMSNNFGQPQICLVRTVAPVASNGGQGRPQQAGGQVLHRYPYAVLQQPGPNGSIGTLRPVQYIVTNPNTGAQSVIYNPRFVTISPQPPPTQPATQQQLASNGGQKPQQQSQQTIRQISPQQVITGIDGSTGMPIRRILVPGHSVGQATVLAPRVISQLQQVQKQNPPPYQYHIQQQQQHQQQQKQKPNHVGGQLPQGHFMGTQHVQQVRLGNPVPHQNPQNPNEHFPHPSEIRRRDGLYAYPQVLLKAGEPCNSSQSNVDHESQDELEEFVQKEQQRTERIRKRYSYTEDEDPTFGFARRPSVRGIRPKFGTTNEIIQQMTQHAAVNGGQIQITKGGAAVNIAQPKIIMTSNGPQLAYACGTLPKNAQLVQVSNGKITPVSHPQMVSIVKQIGQMQLGEQCSMVMTQNPISAPQLQHQQRSQTLPRQSSGQAQTVRIVDSATLVNAAGSNGQTPNAATTLSRDQLKLQLHKQFERQLQQQAKLSVLNNNDESNSEGSNGGFSPSHPIAPEKFAKGTSNSLSSSVSGTNENGKAVNNGNNNKSNEIGNKGNGDVVYYSMNV